MDMPEAVALPGGRGLSIFWKVEASLSSSPFTSYPAEELLGHRLIYVSFAFYFHIMHRMENPPRH